jgi:hypothetical protein
MNTSSGIYRIRIGDWFYFGSTNNFERRKKEHFRTLNGDRHKNQILQRAYNKYKTLIFEECAYENEPDKLLELEQLVLDECFGKDHCANLNPNADRPISHKGLKRSQQTRDKISFARRNIKTSDETKLILTEAALNRSSTKMIIATNEQTGEVIYSRGPTEMSRLLGINPTTVFNALKRNSLCRGKWKFKEVI